jgi:hypothetical protein
MAAPAPVGANVSLYYDGLVVDVGDLIVTRTQRCYRVTSVRIQARGEHVGRQHLRADVVDYDSAVEQAQDDSDIRVRRLYWYSRN